MRRIIVMVAILIVVLGILTGCGKVEENYLKTVHQLSKEAQYKIEKEIIVEIKSLQNEEYEKEPELTKEEETLLERLKKWYIVEKKDIKELSMNKTILMNIVGEVDLRGSNNIKLNVKTKVDGKELEGEMSLIAEGDAVYLSNQSFDNLLKVMQHLGIDSDKVKYYQLLRDNYSKGYDYVHLVNLNVEDLFKLQSKHEDLGVLIAGLKGIKLDSIPKIKAEGNNGHSLELTTEKVQEAFDKMVDYTEQHGDLVYKEIDKYTKNQTSKKEKEILEKEEPINLKSVLVGVLEELKSKNAKNLKYLIKKEGSKYITEFILSGIERKDSELSVVYKTVYIPKSVEIPKIKGKLLTGKELEDVTTNISRKLNPTKEVDLYLDLKDKDQTALVEVTKQDGTMELLYLPYKINGSFVYLTAKDLLEVFGEMIIEEDTGQKLKTFIIIDGKKHEIKGEIHLDKTVIRLYQFEYLGYSTKTTTTKEGLTLISVKRK